MSRGKVRKMVAMNESRGGDFGCETDTLDTSGEVAPTQVNGWLRSCTAPAIPSLENVNLGYNRIIWLVCPLCCFVYRKNTKDKVMEF